MEPTTFTQTYEKYGDVLFVEIAKTPADANIETMEVGEQVGFPGQIVVRFDAETGVLYGVVIERYSAVEKKLKRNEAKQNAKLALEHLLERIRAALAAVCPSVHMPLQLA